MDCTCQSSELAACCKSVLLKLLPQCQLGYFACSSVRYLLDKHDIVGHPPFGNLALQRVRVSDVVKATLSSGKAVPVDAVNNKHSCSNCDIWQEHRQTAATTVNTVKDSYVLLLFIKHTRKLFLVLIFTNTVSMLAINAIPVKLVAASLLATVSTKHAVWCQGINVHV